MHRALCDTVFVKVAFVDGQTHGKVPAAQWSAPREAQVILDAPARIGYADLFMPTHKAKK